MSNSMRHQQVADTQLDLTRIVPFFQPIIDLHQQSVWRYECLARLITPEQMCMPSDFLKLLARESDSQALAESMFCQCAKYFHNLDMAWNINLSSNDLFNQVLSEKLVTLLREYPHPSRVSVEVSAETATRNVQALQAFTEHSLQGGIGLFIDNVGARPVNIKLLFTLPLRGIKLAGSLLEQVTHSVEARDFVTQICEYANERSVSIVAEQIESENALAIAKAFDIRYVQGFLFAKPSASVTSANAPH